MLSKSEYEIARNLAIDYFNKAGIVLTEEEKENIEIADFGLNELYKTGLQIVTYINTERVCAKEMVLFPGQMCPEHTHPVVGDYQGKEETFRCRYGDVVLDIEENGERKKIHLHPGDQFTLYPNTPHSFQAGRFGAVVSEFSTKSMDESDIFTNKNIKRAPEVDS